VKVSPARPFCGASLGMVRERFSPDRSPMDVAAFAADLPAQFGGDVFAEHPVDRRFKAVVDEVEGMTTEHTLTLLNLAVAHLAPGEVYLEVGSYRGRSLVGAMLGQSDARRAVAVESFREFGVDPDATEAEVMATLERFGVRAQVRWVRAEAFKVMRGALGSSAGKVGVYFYDGAHSRVAQYLGLAMGEALLADEALVVVDDASWRQVDASTRSYVERHPGYRLVADLAAEHDFDPRWCNGVKVYAWSRPAGWQAPAGFEVAWRRYCHLYALEPARHLAWQVLPRFPKVMAAAKRAYVHGGTSVPPPGS
jgi:predicted O-methyltransferase YrrM